MAKITFRADEDLVERLEAFEASKSEVMREALRAYLDEAERETTTRASDSDDATLDSVLAARVDELVAERLDAHLSGQFRRLNPRSEPRDVNVNVTLEGVQARDAEASVESESAARKTPAPSGADEAQSRAQQTCSQCGEPMDGEHVYCPNCGEKASHRVFCECGDEIRSDWAFCPSCGRRTPAADVLDRP